jgi:hypothetical protein
VDAPDGQSVPETPEEQRLADSEEEGWPLVEVQQAEIEQVRGATGQQPAVEDAVADAEEEGLPPVPAAEEPAKKRRRAAGRPAGAPTV